MNENDKEPYLGKDDDLDDLPPAPPLTMVTESFGSIKVEPEKEASEKFEEFKKTTANVHNEFFDLLEEMKDLIPVRLPFEHDEKTKRFIYRESILDKPLPSMEEIHEHFEKLGRDSFGISKYWEEKCKEHVEASSKTRNVLHYLEGLGITQEMVYKFDKRFGDHIDKDIWQCEIDFKLAFIRNPQVYIDINYKGSKHDDCYAGMMIYLPSIQEPNNRDFIEIGYAINDSSRGFSYEGDINFGTDWDLDKSFVKLPAWDALDLLIQNANLLHARSSIESTLLSNWKKLEEDGKDYEDLYKGYIRHIDRHFIK